MEASPTMQQYFDHLHEAVKAEYVLAKQARKQGHDPEQDVDIPLAKNMVERVEGLISAVAPQLIGSGVSQRMFALEEEHGVLDWRVSLVIALEIAQEKFCTFTDKKEAIEIGIRTGFAYHTLGIVAAPLEGFIDLSLKKTRKGEEYFCINFAGPIRGAGGTGASVCVLIADYVRKQMGYAAYDPDEKETKRYVTELNDYHERITNLQYHPSEEEILFLAERIPVEIGGIPTESIDVSNYKDLPRVETNKIRGGLCLVFSMVALKAPKLWKRLEKWGEDMDMDWGFMNEFITLQKAKKAGTEEKKEKPKIAPDRTYISDIVAGRPVLSLPLTPGGFRLRYGRTRTTGYSAAAIHPATMHLLQGFIAVGTQLKLERPGKAASITSCDSLEGPVARLQDGSVVRVDDEEQARQLASQIDKILYLGDILLNFGDFSENGHVLVPAGYCEEWWVQELEKSMVNLFGTLDVEKALSVVPIEKESFRSLLHDPFSVVPSPKLALFLSEKFDLPLHPYYTPYYSVLTSDDLKQLYTAFTSVQETDEKLIFSFDKHFKLALERAGIPHQCVVNERIVITDFAQPLKATLGLLAQDASVLRSQVSDGSVLTFLQSVSAVPLRDKAGTFIGARMGRPEKAKMRKLTGNPHALFPIGEEGGRLRSFQSALEAGKVTANFPLRFCTPCDQETVFPVCEQCGKKTDQRETTGRNGEMKTYSYRSIPFSRYFEQGLKHLGMAVYPDLIKGVRGVANKHQIPEHPSKGILRAKHDLAVNKDGTIRYDMTELPLTHFTPQEIGTPVETLKRLGYEKDITGKPLIDAKQVLELKPQDVVLPSCNDALDESADEILYRTACFVDDLLELFYKQPRHYNFTSKADVVGCLVVGLAPHISSGMIGRVIGFSKTSGCFAHPLWHAALRRDCDGDEASVSLLLDMLLNFSRQFLPDRIGSRTMDAPLVLTATLNPSEVDDMVHGLDVVSQYPLSFYEAALTYANPWDASLDQLGKFLHTERQYEGIGFTHPLKNMNQGILCSSYKLLPSMQEKLDGQMHLATMIAAVNSDEVAKLVIEKHFIKDIKGNLRKFSMQQFRCVKCNEKFRRPPLSGVCTACKGKILFTISEGSIVKYLEPAMHLSTTYLTDPYLQQTLDLTQKRIEEVFGKEKERQEGLQTWIA